MLRRVGLGSASASRLVRPRFSYTNPIHNLPRFCRPAAHQQARQQARAFHYDPHAVVVKLPLKTRLKYMGYGALWLVALGVGRATWELYGLYAEREAMQDELKSIVQDLRAFQENFVTEFEQARAAGDHRRLGFLTVDLLLHTHADEATGQLLEYYSSFGELPGLPYDNPRSGHELVPREDTLILLEQANDDIIGACHVAVNLELDEVYRTLIDPKPEPETDKLLELFTRIEDQIRVWRRQGQLFEDKQGEVQLIIMFHFRDWSWPFEYTRGHWDSLSGPAHILTEGSTVDRAEQVVEALEKEGKGFFGRISRS
ncbi:hypothetical protein BJ166DRAFT_595660 [Pestalotiopsis sp. NC0098]|nr:hypothetical protein BJ166DRAFT_595660 [Pestalotiopsis sp. NC0098]